MLSPSKIYVACEPSLREQFISSTAEFKLRCHSASCRDMPVPIPAEINPFASFHRQSGKTVYLFAIRGAAAIFAP
jgi:hypothetical protein